MKKIKWNYTQIFKTATSGTYSKLQMHFKGSKKIRNNYVSRSQFSHTDNFSNARNVCLKKARSQLKCLMYITFPLELDIDDS